MTAVSLSVFLSTSIWFTGTAAAPAISRAWSLNSVQASWLTIAVQIGFIIGTFLYALLNLSDLFGPRRVYLISSLAGALLNGLFALASQNLGTAVLFRFLAGFSLAGIYPVGMKIIAGWFKNRLGLGLGFMVGALTLGTGLPYMITGMGAEFNWRSLILLSSLLTTGGGLIIYFGVKDGPYLTRKARFDPLMALKVFRFKPFRLQSLGYFGHMWELYAFWSLILFYISDRFAGQKTAFANYLPLLVFSIIAAGAAGCLAGGWLSQKAGGERRVALISMCVSGTIAFFSGLIFTLPSWILIPLVLVWGFFVIADSPQFSAMAVQTCPEDYTGTALTIQNGIGFAITVLSIQLLPILARSMGWRWVFTILAPGPLLGALAIIRLGRLTNRD